MPIVTINKKKLDEALTSANIRAACKASGVHESTIYRVLTQPNRLDMQERTLKKFIDSVNSHESNGFKVERMEKLDYRTFIEN